MKQEENNQSCVHLDKANQKINLNTPEGCEICCKQVRLGYICVYA